MEEVQGTGALSAAGENVTRSTLHLFSLNCGRAYAEKVAGHLGTALSDHEERDFEDSEYKVRPLASVRASDVFVVQSLHGDDERSADEKLCRLLFFIGALKDASAGRVTAVVPYLCFARKDRKTKPRDPVTTRYLAGLFEAVGTDRVVTLDVHNLAAFQNAFRCCTEHHSLPAIS
jgi:ribose-phosphate pyrophosphokinase